MAQKKAIKFLEVGAFDGPVQNGKYQNWEALCQIDDSKGGQSEVVVQVGSSGMADKFKPGVYTGFFCGKTDSGVWKVCVQARDNEGLGAPPQDGGYGGGGGGGGGGRPARSAPAGYDNGLMACACGLAKSLIESGKIEDMDGAVDGTKAAYNSLKEFAAEGSRVDFAKAAEKLKADEAAKEQPAESDAGDIPF